ncbi:MAG: hypothetical protein HY791_04150 [Deltaproteobacteria bacterium]|nr:hypothetical protein [Deltaproteobacteria bacterium]
MVGWNRAMPGREAAANETFGKWQMFLMQEQGAGRIQGFEHYLIQAHGGDLNGFTMVKGSYSQLTALEGGEVFIQIITEAMHSMQDMGVTKAFTGEAMMNQMGRWQKVWAK